MSLSVPVGLNTPSAPLEHTLDVTAYLPVFSTVSSLIRLQLSLVQTIASLSAYVLYHATKKLLPLSLQKKINWSSLSHMHQCAIENKNNVLENCVRSLVEFIPFINTTTIAYDIKKCQNLMGHSKLLNLPEVTDQRIHMPLLYWLYYSSTSLPKVSQYACGLTSYNPFYHQPYKSNASLV